MPGYQGGSRGLADTGNERLRLIRFLNRFSGL
jgi:hypothetical protein